MASVDDLNNSMQDLVRAIGQLTETVLAIFPLSTITGSAVFDPPSIAAGAQTSTTVPVVGAVMGQFVTASFSLDLQLIQLIGYVSAADVVTVIFRNGTAGAIDLASGTLAVRGFG